tara:strand:- start:32 stop:346 length:315 start_codon:yes stop_codon:yes gene_type:complete
VPLKLDATPSDPGLAGGPPAAPPPPITTGTVPCAFNSLFKTPPAPPPAALSLPPPPPPEMIAVLTILVPDRNVMFPEDVLDVITSFPNEVALVLPMIPPLVLGI